MLKQRNQPTEPPKKPEQAPFFLPTLPGVEHRFAIEENKEKKTEKKTRLDKTMAKSKSILQTRLANLKKGSCEHVCYILFRSNVYMFSS
jgi:U3 small nucleolar RNA-associated protein 21